MHDWLDSSIITSQVFYVRKTPRPLPNDPHVRDGVIPVAEGVALGYRYYHKPDAPVMVFFHGNGEIATDYDSLAPYYHVAGVGLLVVDYRGYGWSGGVPLVTQLLPDALKVVDAVPSVLAEHGIQDVRLFLKGRSLGSAPAIYAAQQRPALFRGLIVESGFADAPSIFRQMGSLLRPMLPDDESLPLYSVRKMAQVTLPLLIIHGERDTVIPVSHAHDLYAAATMPDKELVIIERAGHNDMLAVNPARYFAAVREFVLKYA